MAPFLDSNPRDVMAALSSLIKAMYTLDVNGSSLIGIEEIESSFDGGYFFLSYSILGPLFGVEDILSRNRDGGFSGGGFNFAHEDISML
jgi:hypothetical protein